MRSSLVTVFAALVLTVPAWAQNSTPQQNPAPATGGVAIGGAPPPSTWHETCVEVEIGGSKAYDCLNEKLKRKVDQVNPVPNIPPIDAKSQDIKIGVFNEPGVRQQYGQNFGHSIVPFRPPPPTFGGPLGGRR